MENNKDTQNKHIPKVSIGMPEGNRTFKPLITTIIPTYRRPKLLRRAIKSVLNQTYPHFQVCVYDNASGDETADVIAEITKKDKRVKYWCHKENTGAFRNFQFGLRHVSTPFFSFLSDDDIILPDFYETALDGFESHPDAMFFATNVFHVGAQDRLLRMPLERWTPGFYRPPDGLMAILEHGHSEWTGILFRKAVTEEVGLLDPEVGFYADLDFTLRIAARCPFVVSLRPCAILDGSSYELRAPSPFELHWPGVLKMVRNLIEDKSIPLNVRTKAESVLLRRFEKGLFWKSLAFLHKGYSVDAKKFANLLYNQFGRLSQWLILSAIIYTYPYNPLAHLAFDSLVACRRFLRAKCLKNNPVLPVSVWGKL